MYELLDEGKCLDILYTDNDNDNDNDSNDTERNPGPHFQNNFFNFMSWNLNSLAKDNFQRVSLIEAHNSIFNYDLGDIH